MVRKKPAWNVTMHVQPNPAIIIIINLVSDYYNGVPLGGYLLG